MTHQTSWVESTGECLGQQLTFGLHCAPKRGKCYHGPDQKPIHPCSRPCWSYSGSSGSTCILLSTANAKHCNMMWCGVTHVQILRVPGGVSEQEEVQVQVTRLLVESYFDVVRKNLQDAVPKAVMHFLVNSVQRGLQQHLIHTLYR